LKIHVLPYRSDWPAIEHRAVSKVRATANRGGLNARELVRTNDLDKRFEPYAVQLGWIAHSWNALHDALGSLFWTLTGSQNGNVPLAIWNSIPNDRTQRGVLRAVAQTVLADKETELQAVLWLLAAADKFEDKRNDALHTPFTFQIDPNDTRLVSKSYSGHKRALKLKNKELLPEFEWYGRSVHILARYAMSIRFALGDPANFAWPTKPKMPERKKTAEVRAPVDGDQGFRLKAEASNTTS
jgi:hypothetical protein